MKKPKLRVVVGGQFGSEAKGAVCEWFAERLDKPGCIRTGGSQAGHTVFGLTGKKVMRQVPVGLLVNMGAQGYIAQGSEVDYDVVMAEVTELNSEGLGITGRCVLDVQATIIDQGHKDTENAGGLPDIGSTKKGVGAARADRVMRNASIVRDVGGWPLGICGVADQIKRDLQTETVLSLLIEGSQGYGLGLHEGHYPTCTSIDCTAMDAIAAAGLAPWEYDVEPWVVLRTFPIRVAGPSGRLYNETTWEELSAETGGYVKPEITSVTKKTRRVGRWDGYLARKAIAANGGPEHVKVALMFFDYVFPECAGMTTRAQLGTVEGAMGCVRKFEAELGLRITLLGTGPESIVLLDEEYRL